MGDLEDDPPSLYRRRDKPVGVKRQRGRRVFRALRLTCLDILLPVAIIYGVYRLAVHAASSQAFLFSPDQSIIIRGNHVVSRGKVLEALGFSGFGTDSRINLAHLSMTAERDRLEDLPWIKSASVARIFPDRLEVSVKERTPVAFASVSGHVELVDSDGALLRMPAKTSFDFPVLYGLDPASSMAQRKQRLFAYLRFIDEDGNEVAQSGWKISEIGLSDPDDLQVLLVRGLQTILVHFGDRDFKQRFKTFLSVAPRVLQSYSRINSMDLRYHNEVVVDPDHRSPPER